MSAFATGTRVARACALGACVAGTVAALLWPVLWAAPRDGAALPMVMPVPRH